VAAIGARKTWRRSVGEDISVHTAILSAREEKENTNTGGRRKNSRPLVRGQGKLAGTQPGIGRKGLTIGGVLVSGWKRRILNEVHHYLPEAVGR
jgi:hypothetical protein